MGDAGGREGGAAVIFWFDVDLRCAGGGHASPRFCPPRCDPGDQPNPGSGGLNIHRRSASPPQPPKPEAGTLVDGAALR